MSRISPNVKALVIALSKYDTATKLGFSVEVNSPVYNEGRAALVPFQKIIDAHNAAEYKEARINAPQ